MQEDLEKEPSVVLEFLGQLRTYIGRESVTLSLKDGASLRDVFIEARRKYPQLREVVSEEGEVSSTYLVFINGKDSELLGGLSYKPLPGDKITLVPVSHGG